MTELPLRILVVQNSPTSGAGRLAEYLPDEDFTPASTLKLAVLVAAARALERGDLRLHQQVPAVSQWASEHGGSLFGFVGDEADQGWPTDGQSLPVGDILRFMVLAVCTRDFPDHPSAVAAIRALARGLLAMHEGGGNGH